MPYFESNLEARQLVANLLEKYHGELHDNEVTVLVQFWYGKPLKHRGYPAYAVVSITPLKDRAAGLPDARIVIDQYSWGKMSIESKASVIDHELEHLSLVYDKKTGEVKKDDLNRPKLKMRLHDYQVGWFQKIADRHGAAAIETQQAAMLADSRGQLLMPWAAAVGKPIAAIAAGTEDAA